MQSLLRKLVCTRGCQIALQKLDTMYNKLGTHSEKVVQCNGYSYTTTYTGKWATRSRCMTDTNHWTHNPATYLPSSTLSGPKVPQVLLQPQLIDHVNRDSAKLQNAMAQDIKQATLKWRPHNKSWMPHIPHKLKVTLHLSSLYPYILLIQFLKLVYLSGTPQDCNPEVVNEVIINCLLMLWPQNL